uniref:Uncharacterized protein n=1 Tax=Timema douglasi TaxID=61478 RepID=A0A7R8V8U7_TIMDO|nr:unnamed protein product [Timema douglasi]
MEASASRLSFELTELEAADRFNLSHIDSEIDVNYDNTLGENGDTGNTNNMEQFWSNAHKPLENSPGTYTKDHGGCDVRFPTFSSDDRIMGHPILLAVNMDDGFCGISIQSSSPSLYDLDSCKVV